MMTKEEYIKKYIDRDIWIYDGIKNKYFQVKRGYHYIDKDIFDRIGAIEWLSPKDINGDQYRYYAFLRDIFPSRETARQHKRDTRNLIRNSNNDWRDISAWFSLSRCSWAVLPRVMMEAMPEDWQKKMGKLLFELDDAFPNFPNNFEYSVNLRDEETGRYLKIPEYMTNYRYPNQEFINFCKPPYKEIKNDY
jgi:hypothetical protein